MSDPVPEPADAPALRADGLSHAYGDRWVLQDLTLSLPRGRTLAVLGPNGAGKSTLLRIVATLLRPTEGGIDVLGCALPKEAWRLRGRIGYLGHQPLLYRDLDATENLAFHARLFALPGGGSERAGQLLEQVGLSHRASTRVDEMSAGMVRRLAVCRAVLHEPELLILDEPLANLDPAGVETVAPLIGPAPGRTRVLVTHDVDAALAEADRVLGLERDGTVAFESPVAEVDAERARRVYAERAGAGR
ncbi:MAG: ABC transporter ATP-binding protein [Solirubrobacterales bacterium]